MVVQLDPFCSHIKVHLQIMYLYFFHGQSLLPLHSWDMSCKSVLDVLSHFVLCMQGMEERE